MLVNNASKQYMYKNFLDTDLDRTEDIFRCNVIQMIAMAKFALPHMSRGDAYVEAYPTSDLLDIDMRLTVSSTLLPS